MKKEDIYHFYTSGIPSWLDIHFARFMVRLAGKDFPELFLAAALVSSYTREGHICLDLSRVEGKRLLEGRNEGNPLVCPTLDDWHSKLRESSVVGAPGEYKPLILDDMFRLYLFRYWDYQEKLVDLIRRRVNQSWKYVDITLLQNRIRGLFSPREQEEIDWQEVSALMALMQRFCVISGGPGTGKTTTVAKIIVLLLEQAGSEKLRVGLAAPTGKAAAKLQESIKLAKKKLNCSDNTKDAIPEEASTIHRLLGSLPDSPYFRHNAENPLSFDAVIVDEASMVDLALMSKLVQALPLQTRLILLGDKDQLASVEAGAVLGDICDTGHAHHFSIRFCELVKKVTGYTIHTSGNRQDETGIQDCIIQLRKSYRFVGDSGIGAVSRAVNAGDGDLALNLLKSDEFHDVKWKKIPQPGALARACRDLIIPGFKGYLRALGQGEAFQLLERFRVLCALRDGPYGVVSVNSMVEQILREEKLIESGARWYRGRPILITSNDYNMRLFNGDIGIVLPDPTVNNDLRVFFQAADNTMRRFHPLRLPEHETVYAMTVHKSQGSEFNTVLLLLSDRDSPVLTRELIYTGITRAKENVEIWGNESVFHDAVSRRAERISGLRDALWKP